MKHSPLAGALDRAADHIRATWEGRRAGVDGLSAEEAADTPYLVDLRHRTRARIAATDAGLRDSLDRLRAHEAELRTRAQADARQHEHDYEQLCAAFGTHWRKRHRDRHFARLGWRCPQLGRRSEADDGDR